MTGMAIVRNKAFDRRRTEQKSSFFKCLKTQTTERN
jgi:hypothetical protein